MAPYQSSRTHRASASSLRGRGGMYVSVRLSSRREPSGQAAVSFVVVMSMSGDENEDEDGWKWRWMVGRGILAPVLGLRGPFLTNEIVRVPTSNDEAWVVLIRCDFLVPTRRRICRIWRDNVILSAVLVVGRIEILRLLRAQLSNVSTIRSLLMGGLVRQ